MAKHKLKQFVDAVEKGHFEGTLEQNYIENVFCHLSKEGMDEEWSRLVKIFRKLEASKPKDRAK